MEALLNKLSKITSNKNDEGLKDNFWSSSGSFRQIRSREAKIYPRKQKCYRQ